MTSLIIMPGTEGGVAIAPTPIVFNHRDTPPEWEIRLREVSPISEEHSWLAIRWYAEAERWVLYECVPNQFINQGIRAELEGAHPDTLEQWARIVSPYQWEMYRKHRVHARPCWVIQGSKGGHKVEFDPADQELCRAVGLPTEPAAPGALPYAPFDERVVQQIVNMSKLVRAKNDLAEFKRRHGTADAHRRTFNNALRDAREKYVHYINAQFEEPGEDFVAALRTGELEDVPKTDKDFVKENEESDQRYIDRGRF